MRLPGGGFGAVSWWAVGLKKKRHEARVTQGTLALIYTRRSKHLLLYASGHPGSLTNKYTLRRCIRRIPLYQNVWRSRLVVGIDAVISRLFSTLTGVQSSSSRIARTVHKSSVRSDAGGLGFKIRDPAYVHKNSCVDVLHRCGLKRMQEDLTWQELCM